MGGVKSRADERETSRWGRNREQHEILEAERGEIHAGRKGNHLHLLRCPPASSSSPWYMLSHPFPTALPEHFEGHEKQHICQIFAALRSNRARCRLPPCISGRWPTAGEAAHVPHPLHFQGLVLFQKAAFSDARRKSRWLNQLQCVAASFTCLGKEEALTNLQEGST